MCGITGFVDFSKQTADFDLHAIVEKMADAIRHRGPDHWGAWVDAGTGLALANRRLAILDLSPEGHQPMQSACGRYVIVFNGEIYNYRALRDELERLGHRFRGHSDTEVMLAGFTQWGLDGTLPRLNGMFGIALWDKQERLLHLIRDRLGEKPLYYGWMGSTLLFGSELKALRAHPGFRSEVDRDSLTLYLRYCYIPAPYSIYRGIFKLPAAAVLTVKVDNPDHRPSPRQYWSVREAAERGVAAPLGGSPEDAVEALDGLLKDAVKLRMESDVPLGAFLSGGIDSSTIAALMTAQSEQPVRTFSIGFLSEGYNEAEYAKAVAHHLGTDHTEFYVTPEEAQAVIPLLPALYDEPFADSSQIPTYLVAKAARRHVTVSLSGDGGDELFHGYKRYDLGQDLWSRVGWMPRWGRRALAGIVGNVPNSVADRGMRWFGSALDAYGRKGPASDKFRKLAEVLAADSQELFYRRLVSHWKEPAALVSGASEPVSVLTDPTQWAAVPTFRHSMMYLDAVTYLPDDILVKVDRACMGVSLEGRVPLLDHRVVEFAWRVPMALKKRGGQNKWLLRQVLDKYVPSHLIDRPKMGFGVPIGEWLRGPLREWAEALLDESRLRREGFFDPVPIRAKWVEHLSGARNWQAYLWDVLMFQSWFEHYEAD